MTEHQAWTSGAPANARAKTKANSLYSGAFSLEVAAEDNCLAIGLRGNNVRFGSLADILRCASYVRFAPEKGLHPNKFASDGQSGRWCS